jgi:general nucleoside transport system permease protein
VERVTVTLMDPVLPARAGISKRAVAAGAFILFGLVDIFLFGLFAKAGDATFVLSVGNGTIHVPNINIPAAPAAYVLGAASLLLGIWRAVGEPSRRARQLSIGAVVLFFVIALLCWAYAGSAIPLNAVNLLQSTLNLSIPLVLGALAGCMCERSGVINIAIEGQLLVGAFAGAVVASAFGALWLGLITGALAGGLLGLVLAVFAIRFFVDQIILGVVLNVLASGLTGYLNDRILVTHPDLNTGLTFSAIKIPVLGSIPIIGPIFFDSSIFLYIMYALILVVQIGLFRTRWGLRVRAVGEHPVAAATVGIRVLATRYRNVVLGGLIAGIGGASLTLGSVGTFSKDMSSGLGYIALAAMIFGRYTPFGAIGAALLFGFTTQLQSVLSSINVPIQSNLLLLTPYVVTIIVVAGLVGKVRGPKAEGVPFTKA